MSATSLDLSQIKTDVLSAASTFRTLIGLGSVNNTADLDKPISTATQTALDLKANSSSLASYLPLAGGTMTDQLNGTVAVFSSTVQAGVFDVPQNGANQSLYNFSSSGVSRGALVFNPSRLEVGIRNNNYSSSGEYSVYVDGSGNFRLRNANVYNSSPVFTVAPTGVVTAPQLQSGTGNLLVIDGGSGISVRHNGGHQHAFATGSFTTRGDNVIQWTSGSDMSMPVDAAFARSGTGLVDFRGNGGLRSRNYANSADAPIAASTATLSSGINLSGAGESISNAGFGFGVYRNSNGAFQWGHSLSQGFLIAHGNASIGFALGADNAPDVRIVRNATGPALQTQAAGGLQVRGAGGSGDAPITASTVTASLGTFSTGIDVGADSGTTQPRIRFGTVNPSSIGSNYGNIEFRIGSGTHPSVSYATRLIIDTSGATRIGENIPIQWRNGDPNGGATLGFITVSGSPSQIMQLNANGSVMVRSDGGLAVKNQANSADAPITASTATLSGNLILAPSASITPSSNGQLTFEATSNTSITVKYKGSDGTVRSAVLTLT